MHASPQPPEQSFYDSMASKGLAPPDLPIADGERYRYPISVEKWRQALYHTSVTITKVLHAHGMLADRSSWRLSGTLRGMFRAILTPPVCHSTVICYDAPQAGEFKVLASADAKIRAQGR